MKFDFRNPTRILFGEDQEKEVGKLLQDYGAKRVLLLMAEAPLSVPAFTTLLSVH